MLKKTQIRIISSIFFLLFLFSFDSTFIFLNSSKLEKKRGLIIKKNIGGCKSNNKQQDLPTDEEKLGGLLISTYFGGSNMESSKMIVDEMGYIYIGGVTRSKDFPTTHGALNRTHDSFTEIFICKFNNDCSKLIYSTFIGSSDGDYLSDLAVDNYGCVYITGSTNQSIFLNDSVIIPPRIEVPEVSGNSDIFICKINNKGTDMEYSTQMGGLRNDYAISIIIDDDNCTYITGTTESYNFPSTNGAYDESHNGNKDAFICKLNNNGTDLEYSTFLGGSNTDQGLDITIDDFRNVYITGYTFHYEGTLFPTTDGAFNRDHGGQYDAFICKMNSDGTDLIYSTLIGGRGEEKGHAIWVDNEYCAYITGYTNSWQDFPITDDSYVSNSLGQNDVYVFKLNPEGSQIVYSTLIGGSDWETGLAICVDSFGYSYVTGKTMSKNFPTTPGAIDGKHNGRRDVFLLKLDQNGTQIDYSTYLGGSEYDEGNSIAMCNSGTVIISGETASHDFPTTNGSFQEIQSGNYDIFFSRIYAKSNNEKKIQSFRIQSISIISIISIWAITYIKRKKLKFMRT
ncbi:hypothetical protein NEF87_001058 [Candidatus Lokiarchaeum ossiferum]|uniref:Beta-propeller repeat protein n=1 Tax=Candidatus Lokiarchaeum ossiferum TaxID=2951803 RepID=A0ABY6HMP1_9ARCH|nr:hypothetical protein NEF87_001058 [Candidatus Lokiarchaeum sp. B-35]